MLMQCVHLVTPESGVPEKYDDNRDTLSYATSVLIDDVCRYRSRCLSTTLSSYSLAMSKSGNLFSIFWREVNISTRLIRHHWRLVDAKPTTAQMKQSTET